MSQHTYNYNTSWEKVARLFPVEKGLRVLDLGCGDGRLVKHLTTDHQVFGVDASLEGVAQAQANGIQAVHGNVNDFSLPWESDLDVVLALDILEHLEQLSAVLVKIKTSLKPTGQLILSLPNHFDLRTRFEILRGQGIIKWSQRAYEKNAWEYAHLRFLTLNETLKMLRLHGFSPTVTQFNFMSQGLLPTRLIPRPVRTLLAGRWPNAWSGKFVIKAGLQPATRVEKIVLDKTPSDF